MSGELYRLSYGSMMAGVQGIEPCFPVLETDASPQCFTPVGASGAPTYQPVSISRRRLSERRQSMVLGEGFEPSLPGPKPGGLPLADPRTGACRSMEG